MKSRETRWDSAEHGLIVEVHNSECATIREEGSIEELTLSRFELEGLIGMGALALAEMKYQQRRSDARSEPMSYRELQEAKEALRNEYRR